MKTTSYKPTQSDLFQPIYVATKGTEQSDREQLRFGRITNTVIKKLENPAISAASRDKVNPTESRPAWDGNYIGPVPVGESESWVDSKPSKQEKGKKVATRKGKVKTRFGKAWSSLTFHDRQDVNQAIAMVLCKHHLLSPGGFVMGTIPNLVWLEIFSESRKACRIDRKKERNAISFQALESADFLQVETGENSYLTRDRTAIARYARIYRDALKAARDKQRAEGNRQWKANYKRYRAFLSACLKASLRGEGWGGLVPDIENPESAHDHRKKAKRSFRAYVLQGLESTHPDYFAPESELDEEKQETVLKDLSELPAFLDLLANH